MQFDGAAVMWRRWAQKWGRGSAWRRGLLLLGLGALAGACSSTQHYASRHHATRVSEVDPRYGVRPSPRLFFEGDEIPKGGGSYMVGKPYKIAGKTYVPSEKPFAGVGAASWYGSDFHGRRTANGEIFDRNSLSAAHPTMPLPSYARVTNLRNSRSIIVRVNDRGPYHAGRLMDVSQRVAEALEFDRVGTARVKVEWVGHANMAGDDDEKLMATLRDDGRPATLPGYEQPVLTAKREEPIHTAALERADIRASAAASGMRDDSAPVEAEEKAEAKPKDAEKDIKDLIKETAASKSAPAPKFAAAPPPPSRPFDLGVSAGKRVKQAAR